MKKVLLLAAIGMATTVSFSQTTDGEKDLTSVSTDTLDGWKKSGFISLGGSQTSLTNWVAGGQNSIALNALFGLTADLKKGDMTWENSLDFGYGILRQGENLFSDDQKWIKSDDRIEINSKYGRIINDDRTLYAAALSNFRTQLTAGYAYPNDSIEISGFLAPAYWLNAVGFDFKPIAKKKGNKFSLFFAPATLKMTFVNDQTLADLGAFGVQEAELDMNNMILAGTGKRFRPEFGGYLRMFYQTNLAPNITYSTKFDVFSNYFNNPTRLDINWENLVNVKLSEYFSATFATHLIYDDDIDIQRVDADGVVLSNGPRVQFKQVLQLGVTWKFKP